ncbi:MAG: phage terminase large subunit family protein [Elioraea tepidiphila]
MGAMLRPPPQLTVSEWAERHRILGSRASSEPGPWRTGRTPYLREIMDALSAVHPARRVVFMKGAQTGGTEGGNNWLGYILHHVPAPVLAVQPTVELAKRFSRQRINPLIEETPVLRERVAPARARDSGNTLLSKEFPGGILVMTGANSAVGLRSMTARFLFLDEIDAYPGDVEGEGDPIALAEARARTFGWRRKTFLVSTPTITGLSRIEREYLASDQRRFFVPCPQCGTMQVLTFERLRWEKGEPRSVAYRCETCDGAVEEHHKTAMLARGEWRATAVAEDPHTVGFHISALYSPVGWLSWEQIARDWEAAQGKPEDLKTFKNTVLGETWQESGDAPDWQRLYERREDWPIGIVPAGALFLTAGADVQRDRIEVSIWAWGRGLESWFVDHVIIDGGPDRAPIEQSSMGSRHAGTWASLTALLGRTWSHASGARLGLAKLAIDTGYEAPAVYAWARRAGHAQVVPVKGVDGFNRAAPIVGPSYVDVTEGGRKLRRGARLWTVAVATFKSETYRFLRLGRPTDEEIAAGIVYPAGYVHLPRGMEAEWVKQLVAEQLVTIRNKRGYAHQEWQKMRERNEALDCRVYARAAAWIAGADRWTEATWRDLEAQVGLRARVGGKRERGTSSRSRDGDPVAPSDGDDMPAPVASKQPDAGDPVPPSAGMLRRRVLRGRRVFTPSYLR